MNKPYDRFDDYGLRYLPAHLVDIELWDELEETLTDLHFIEAKCAVGMTNELVQDYSLALRLWRAESTQQEILPGHVDELTASPEVVRLFAQFVSLHSHTFGRNATQVI